VTRAELLKKLAVALSWPDLAEDTPLSDDPRWDSVAQLDVLVLLQKELGVSAGAEQLQEVTAAAGVLDLALR
jgi:acyl carrier protein